jgi:hypothetical protein
MERHGFFSFIVPAGLLLFPGLSLLHIELFRESGIKRVLFEYS